ncbi:hypothetical protein RAC89_30260 [Paenibacillus sp. GD4]|jgi:phenylpyruvate tautomerase PptA (4-oxalocrotonate tautomerase family)|uniref:hypothetical protein n=1 Tax=Paenibacillus sp. GD4 TaxID=3068890 RepID=UPI002796D7AC|nr:hypothetical protein [Paenibacillus sp. GD4]MDQ1914669.1 hypothetical protein [Paenibacillus sp. GD4]
MFIPNIDQRSEESAKASIAAAVTEYHAYLAEANSSELQKLLEEMEAAKTAYFNALTDLKKRLQELSLEEQRLSDLMREYGVEGSLPSLTINKLTHPHHFISTYEIIADRALD